MSTLSVPSPAIHLEAFVSKCETYLQQRAGLIPVDVVTERGGYLHQDLFSRLMSGRVGNCESRINDSIACYHDNCCD